MSQQQAPRGQQVTEYAKANIDKDPQAVLEMVLAETERVKSEAERERQDSILMANVEFTAQGLRPKDMAGVWRMARMYSASSLVPVHFQGKVADCAIAIQMALRCKVDPMAFLQKCYIVYGRPSIETTLAVAMANTSGVLKSRITYRLEGEGAARKCTAIATLKESGEVINSEVSVRIAHAMGWWDKKDSLWPKMTDLMLQYRSAMWLIRAYMPEVLMGIYSIDEARDMEGHTELADAAATFGFVGVDDLPGGKQHAAENESRSKTDALADKLAAGKTATPPAQEKPKEAVKPTKTTKKAPEKPVETAKTTEAVKTEEATWTPPEEQEEIQPAQEVTEEPPAKTMTKEELIAYQTDLISEWMKKNKAAADLDTVDAEYHFDIESQADKFAPEQLAWCKKKAEEQKAKILREEKQRTADVGKTPPTQQKHMLGD